jgi:hypothetical protein
MQPSDAIQNTFDAMGQLYSKNALAAAPPAPYGVRRAAKHAGLFSSVLDFGLDFFQVGLILVHMETHL